MEQQILQETKKPNALAFQVAITFSLYTFALLFIFQLMGIDSTGENTTGTQKAISMVLSYVPFIVAIYYAQDKHKKDLGGFVTYGRAFSTGFKIAAYSGLFIAILMVFYYKVIDQAAMQAVIDAAIAKAGDNEEQIKGVEMISKYMVIFIAFGAAISYTIFGLIISLITAAIVKKERPLHFESEA